MIELTKLNHEVFYLNEELIEIIEQVPDTLITMRDGKKYYAVESPQEIIQKIIEFERLI